MIFPARASSSSRPSGGSGFGKSIEELSPSCPNAVIREGRMLNGNPSEQELRQWVESL